MLKLSLERDFIVQDNRKLDFLSGVLILTHVKNVHHFCKLGPNTEKCRTEVNPY